MSTATITPGPWFSGFCGLRLGPDSHGRCPAALDGRPCACTCHQTPAAVEPVYVMEQTKPLLSLVVPLPEEVPEYDLGDALLQLDRNVDVLGKALLTFTGNDTELCDLLGQVRSARQQLAQLEAVLERDAARLMTADLLEWEGGTAERRWGKDRKEWRHDDLVRAVTAAIVPALAVDSATGEVDDDLAALLHQALEQYAATNRPSWRVTAVKPLGIDPDDYCQAVPGRPTVQVHLAGDDQ